MSSRTTGTAEDGYSLGAIQKVGEYVEFVFGRADGRLNLGKMHSASFVDGRPQYHIARNGYNSNTAPRDCGLHRDLQHAGHLLRLRDQFTIMTALTEELIRMSLLKVSTSDFTARNLRGDGEDGDAAPMAIVEAIDEVQVARSAASGAHRQFASEVGLGAGSECGHLFMAHVNPLDLLASANRICDPIQRIPTDAVNSLDSCFLQNIYKQVSYVLCHVIFLPQINLSPACTDDSSSVKHAAHQMMRSVAGR